MIFGILFFVFHPLENKIFSILQFLCYEFYISWISTTKIQKAEWKTVNSILFDEKQFWNTKVFLSLSSEMHRVSVFDIERKIISAKNRKFESFCSIQLCGKYSQIWILAKCEDEEFHEIIKNFMNNNDKWTRDIFWDWSIINEPTCIHSNKYLFNKNFHSNLEVLLKARYIFLRDVHQISTLIRTK